MSFVARRVAALSTAIFLWPPATPALLLRRNMISARAMPRSKSATLCRIAARLDRPARSTRDFLNMLDTISKAGAGFKSLAGTWADTTTPHGRLMLTVLGGLAECERELIKARTSEGRTRAQARGVHMGRSAALNRDQQREALARRAVEGYRADVRG